MPITPGSLGELTPEEVEEREQNYEGAHQQKRHESRESQTVELPMGQPDERQGSKTLEPIIAIPEEYEGADGSPG